MVPALARKSSPVFIVWVAGLVYAGSGRLIAATRFRIYEFQSADATGLLLAKVILIIAFFRNWVSRTAPLVRWHGSTMVNIWYYRWGYVAHKCRLLP